MLTWLNRILVLCVSFLILALGWLCYAFISENKCPVEQCNYIAHGGGEIDGYTYTNSIDAVEHSIQCGIKYIELDLILTADSVLVAAHSWKNYNEMVGNDNLDYVPAFQEFKDSKLYGKYSTLTFKEIDSVMLAHPEIILVTDKMSDPNILEKYIIKYKERTIVECLSIEDYYYYMDHGYLMSMYRDGASLIRQFIRFVNRKLQGKSNRYNACVVYKGSHEKIRCSCKFVYTGECRQEADSLFAQYPDVKFMYIDNVE